MKISGIDFPKPLLTALRNGRLVVFAGAGVSMGEPADLPDFENLARAIAKGTGSTLEQRGLEDVFLGRLHDRGIAVHELAARELSKNNPQPTDLHKDLLRLHLAKQSVRLVTTNFDLLFERAAEEVLDRKPEVFRAPALPRGTNFTGIVHVHGAIDRANEMVLTDADFGRAYLVEGWARRFLVDLFRSFTVLFVGYSHSDVVMNYLARALPPADTETPFALTDESHSERWQALGIEPISFPRSPGDHYRPLYEGVNGLAKHVTRGTLDWQRVIAAIAENPPSLNREDMDLIDDAISDPERVHFFTSTATHPEWIYWLEIHGHLAGLFQSDELADPQRRLAFWLVETFSSQAPDRLFFLIGRQGMRLNYTFWVTLARKVGQKNSDPSNEGTFTRWVSLLLQTMPETPSPEAVTDFLYLLGEECIQLGQTETLVEIFRKLSGIRLTPSGTLAGFEPRLLGQHFALERIWENGLSTNLDTLAHPILEIVVEGLSTQYNEYRIWQDPEHRFDPVSALRWAIEPCEHDEFPISHDVLIDAARGCLEYMSTHQPDELVDWRERLAAHDAPVLRRLAVHAVFQSANMSADQKLDWLLGRTWLHVLSENHEIFRVVEDAYQKAGNVHRESFVNSVLAHSFEGNGQEQEDYLTANYQHDWLHLLTRVAPGCNYAKSALKNLRDRYPDLGRQEQRPPLTDWEALDPVSPRPVAELKDSLLSYLDSDPSWPNGTIVLSRIEKTASQNFAWSIDLADTLSANGLWDTNIWDRLLRVWERKPNPDTRMQVLARLKSPDLHEKHARGIAGVLYSFVKEGEPSNVSDPLLEEAGKIARALWKHLRLVKPGIEQGDLLRIAINHPAGTIGQFWCASHSLWREQDKSHSDTFITIYREALSEIAQDRTLSGRHGRAVLARNFTYLLDTDGDWTRDNLLPLFEDPGNEDDYRAVWHGFLYGVPLNPPVAELMEKPFLRVVTRMRTTFAELELQNLFIDRLTTMLAYFVDDPIAEWIPEFFRQADSEDRRRFAMSIRPVLRDMPSEQQQELWGRWLERYWENRLRGIPEPLEDGEVDAMLTWLPEFRDLYSGAVEHALRMPPTLADHNLIFHVINSKQLGTEYPKATAKLLIHLAESKLPPWASPDVKEIIDALLDPDIDLAEDLRMKLEEVRVRIGL